MRIVIVIPARLGSQRLPGKPLAMLAGEPLVVHTARRAAACRSAADVVVATDAAEIAAAVRAAGFPAVMTSDRPRNGSERVFEAWGKLGGDVIVNLQADEPFVEPADLDALAAGLVAGVDGGWATLRRPLTSRAEWRRPDVVKVLCADDGRALYFSRAPLPAGPAGLSDVAAADDDARPPPAGVWAHLGIYGFTAAALAAYAALPPHPLEAAERLEQLRGLGAGMALTVLDARSRGQAIDTPADLSRARRALAARPPALAAGG